MSRHISAFPSPVTPLTPLSIRGVPSKKNSMNSEIYTFQNNNNRLTPIMIRKNLTHDLYPTCSNCHDEPYSRKSIESGTETGRDTMYTNTPTLSVTDTYNRATVINTYENWDHLDAV